MSNSLDLERYFERIGYRGSPRADLETLREVHRRHLYAIPYENLDVQLERPVGIDVGPVYHKLVHERRGGWCYEMNGLFSWALEAIGFRLTRLAAGVGRASRGDAAIGNHLAIRVELDRPYLADVGFGDGLIEPIPIEEATVMQRGFAFRLESIGHGWWRLHNHERGGAPSFDFDLHAADRAVLARQCTFLQSAESPFRQVSVVQRHVEDGVATLRGRVLKRIRSDGVSERVIADREDYVRTLRELFGLEPPQPDLLWAKAAQQHERFIAVQ